MSSVDTHRICDSISACWKEKLPGQPGWLTEQKPFDRPLQPGLNSGKTNCVLYYGASFNPPHQGHGTVLKTVYEAGPHIMPHLDMHLAGAMIGCSRIDDLIRKTSEQRGEFGEIMALPSQDRHVLWHQGVLETKLDGANVTGFDGWSEFWTWFDFVGVLAGQNGQAQQPLWQDGKYQICLARVVKLDEVKHGHNSVFADSEDHGIFQPLYYRDQPGSNQPSAPNASKLIGMRITIATDAGGYGSCWMSREAGAPRRLKQYTQWENIWQGNASTAVTSIWKCQSDQSEGGQHQVFYVHTGAAGDVVQSVDAWAIINDGTTTDGQKVEKLKDCFAPEMLLKKARDLLVH